MKVFNLENSPKFRTSEEELKFLRTQLSQEEKKQEVKREIIAESIIQEYRKYEPHEVLHRKTILKDVEKLVLRLDPEPHDNKMEELLGILLDKGISNALNVVSKLNNPHLDDDFHRFLVQYLHSTHKIPGLKNTSTLLKSLDMKLFEITLNNKKNSRKLMEQFYASICSTEESDNRFVLEIAQSENDKHFVFYIAIPNSKVDLFVNQLVTIFSEIDIREISNDYNIFSENNFIQTSYVTLTKNSIPTYDLVDLDPLELALNKFSKIKKGKETMAIQFVVYPPDNDIINEFHNKIEKDTLISFNKKIKGTIVAVNIRFVVSAQSKERAEQILLDIESSFSQDGDNFNFHHSKIEESNDLIHDFSYRIFSKNHSILLNLKELSTISHFL